eukprot:scaffold2612_cov132-Skeletonema_menzelii.AAC.13
MKGLKAAAAFVPLNNGNHHHHHVTHVRNNHHGGGWSCFNNASSLRHRSIMFVSTRWRHRYHSSLPLQSITDDNNSNSEDIANDNANGIFLDLDTYLQAEEMLLRPDGSLSTSKVPNQSLQNNNNEAYQSALLQGLFPPTYSYPDTKDEQELSDEELLLQSLTDIQNEKSALTQQQQQIDAETLHQQVFAEEQVYLEQSEEFRKSLSNNLQSDDDSYETPMARGRREALEEYNRGILDELLREIEEMEAGAISREDALARAQTSDSLVDAADNDNDAAERLAFCSQCGLKVTPDMTQRAKYGPQKLLCQACYGMKFRVKDEADVRLAPGPSVWESNRMFDQKKKSNSRKVRMDKSRMSRGSVLDTSSLFRIPDSRIPNDQIPDDSTEIISMREVEIPTREEDRTKAFSSNSRATPTENKATLTEPTRVVQTTNPTASGGVSSRSKESNVKKSSTPKVFLKQQRRPTSSRLLGGRELERRKTQQKSDDDDVGTDLPGLEKQQVEDVIIEEEAAFANEPLNEWIKVEDSTTKRIMYWNKATGEMKRNID